MFPAHLKLKFTLKLVCPGTFVAFSFWWRVDFATVLVFLFPALAAFECSLCLFGPFETVFRKAPWIHISKRDFKEH